jgi:hypothetical protein
VVTERATDRVVLAAVFDGLEKLGDDESRRSLFDVFSERPPAVIVSLLDVVVRTCKARYVIPHPLPCARVRDKVDHAFLRHGIEEFHIGAEIVGRHKRAGAARQGGWGQQGEKNAEGYQEEALRDAGLFQYKSDPPERKLPR